MTTQIKRRLGDRLSESALLFLLFGFVGWLYEVALAFYYGHGFVNRGFLFGPYLPLYGGGALILITCLGGVMRRDIHIGKVSVKPVVMFTLIVLITTAIEYIASVALELLFDQRWWDYSTYQYQLHGRIALSASVRFGLGGMIFLYLLLPLFRGALNRIPAGTRRWLGYAVLALILVDFVATLAYGAIYGYDPVLAQPGTAKLLITHITF